MKAALSGQPPLPLFTAAPDQLKPAAHHHGGFLDGYDGLLAAGPGAHDPALHGIVTEPTVLRGPGAPFPTVPPPPPATIPPRCTTTKTRPAASTSTAAPPSTTTTTRAPPGC